MLQVAVAVVSQKVRVVGEVVILNRNNGQEHVLLLHVQLRQNAYMMKIVKMKEVMLPNVKNLDMNIVLNLNMEIVL